MSLTRDIIVYDGASHCTYYIQYLDAVYNAIQLWYIGAERYRRCELMSFLKTLIDLCIFAKGIYCGNGIHGVIAVMQ